MVEFKEKAPIMKELLSEVAFIEGHIEALSNRINELYWNITGKKGNGASLFCKLSEIDELIFEERRKLAKVITHMHEEPEKPAKHFVKQLESILMEKTK